VRLKILPPAQEELGEAVVFYGSRRRGLGRAFLSEVKRGFTQLKREPLIGSPIENGERKYVLQGFPYNLIYQIDEATIVILAAAHHSREYGYWRQR
jgi:plasmid stabilization system protein ParE